MDPIDYARWVAKFRALIADHGTFAERQLHEYVSLMTKRNLTQKEGWALTDAAVEAGAKLQKFDGLVNAQDPRVYRFPATRRRGLPGRKQDKHTVDMFSRSTGAEELAREREKKLKKLREEDERRARIARR